ncbi:MAG: hypothetical protein B6U95_03925 [Thermofilum sp. ex4484_82]|nr:MAG: hypothetical protein B6U95_03925 [Thermofilum sp. ex4484_82]OYT38631.1 MAG: hypothetical protein B6U96_03920 [Archaeoglobales archaeon ex4484_92]
MVVERRGGDMSRKSVVVKVKGYRSPVSRYGIEEGRINFKLSFEGIVDESSYLFTGSLVGKLPSYSEILKKVDEKMDLFASNIDAFINEINRIFSMYQGRMNTTQYSVRDTPAIPGSAIKGSVRSNLEYRFKPFQVGPNYYSYSCYISQGRYVNKKFAAKHLAFWGEEVSFERKACEANQVCILCDMFGNPRLASRTYFSDAVLVEGDLISIPELNVKAVASGSRFKFTVTALNYNYSELGLLLFGFNILGNSEAIEPLIMGKFKYRYNPRVGGQIKGKYFGLMKFKLIDAVSCNFQEVIKEDVSKLVAKAKLEMEKEDFARYLDRRAKIGRLQ